MIKPQSFAISAPVFFFGLPAEARRPFVLGGAAVALPLAAASFAVEPGWVGQWLAGALALQGSEYSNATGWTLGRAVGGPAVSVAAVGGALFAFAAWWRLRRPAFAELIAGAIPISVFVHPTAGVTSSSTFSFPRPWCSRAARRWRRAGAA